MERALAGKQNETLQSQQPQQNILASPPGPSQAQERSGDERLGYAVTPSSSAAASVVTRPSMVTLGGNDSYADLVSHTTPPPLPESPKAPTGAKAFPAQSAVTATKALPTQPSRPTESTAVPLAPAHDPGKWRTKLRGFKRPLGDFWVRSHRQLAPNLYSR